MVPSPVFFLLFLAGCCATDAEVTKEDLKEAVIQIVGVVRSTEDKLERHEYRDRALGERLKKGISNIEKKIERVDSLEGTVGKLDQRMAALDAMLYQNNEREKMQLQKTYLAVLDIQRNLSFIVGQLKNNIASKITSGEPLAQIVEPGISKTDFEKFKTNVLDEINKVTSTVKQMESELNKIIDDNTNLNVLNNKSSENLDKVKKHLDTSEHLLAKYENKLTEYNNKSLEIPVPDYKEQNEWRNNFLKVLGQQKSQVDQVLSDVKTLESKLNDLPQTYDLNALQNVMLEKLLELKSEVAAHPNITLNLVANAVNSHSDANDIATLNTINGFIKEYRELSESFYTYCYKFR